MGGGGEKTDSIHSQMFDLATNPQSYLGEQPRFGRKEPPTDPNLPLSTDGAKVKGNTALRETSDQCQASMSG